MFDEIEWVAILSNSHIQVALATMVVTMAFYNLIGSAFAILFNGLMRVTLWRNLQSDEVMRREIVTLPVKVERMAQNHTECLIQNATLIERVDHLESRINLLIDSVQRNKTRL
jgi:hypothetical protein